jgi:hypothetical protein
MFHGCSRSPVGTNAAVQCASHATGVRVRNLPIRLEQLLGTPATEVNKELRPIKRAGDHRSPARFY